MITLEEIHTYIVNYKNHYGKKPKDIPLTNEEITHLMVRNEDPKIFGLSLRICELAEEERVTSKRSRPTSIESVKEVCLQKLRFQFEHSLSFNVLDERIEVNIDHFTKNIVSDISFHVLSQQQPPIVIKYPRNWIESIKERLYMHKHISKFFAKKYPVNYTIKTIDIKVIYPDLEISIPPTMSRAIVLVKEGL